MATTVLPASRLVVGTGTGILYPPAELRPQLNARVLAHSGAARGADPVEWFAEGTGRVHGAGVRVDGRGRL